MSDLHKRMMFNKLPPMAPAGVGGSSGSRGGKRGMMRGRRDYTPSTWDSYFSHIQDIKIRDDIVYSVGEQGPVCLFLHGGGFSALSWAVLSKSLSDLVTCRCVAVDLRGHGDTSTADETDLSAESLSSDVGNIIKALYGEDEPPPIILVGHSMGGSVAVHTAYRGLVPSLIGLVVIDVVEGTAMDALQSMQSYLRGRPSRFKSLEYAIEWCIRSGQVRNLESAKVSMVGQVKRVVTNETATLELEQDSMANEAVKNSDSIAEEPEDGTSNSGANGASTAGQPDTSFKKPEQPGSDCQYTWRIDLSKTEKFWAGWFQGLSEKFLACECPKMLLLAGVDRLDKELTIGQMQGKFQMQVLPQCGHAVHEDSPDKVADVLASFMVRHRVAEATANFQRVFPSC